MKKLLLTGFAALLLATGTAYAEYIEQVTCSECKAIVAACEKSADEQHLRDDAKDTFVDHCVEDYMDKHKNDEPTITIREK